VLRHQVLNEGRSIRRVARELEPSRNTVAKYLEQSEPVRRGGRPRGAGMGSGAAGRPTLYCTVDTGGWLPAIRIFNHKVPWVRVPDGSPHFETNKDFPALGREGRARIKPIDSCGTSTVIKQRAARHSFTPSRYFNTVLSQIPYSGLRVGDDSRNRIGGK